MNRPIGLKLVVNCAIFLSVANPATAIEVLDWNLGTAVEQSPGGTAGDGSNTPVNPYIETELAVLGISSASTARYYAWSDTGAEFLATANLAAAGSGGGTAMASAASGAAIFITSSGDLHLTIDASFSYALGPGDRTADLQVLVFKQNPIPPPPSTPLFYGLQRAQPIFGDPPNGMFVVQHELFLPAGETYVLGYLMELRSFGGSPEVLSLGSGHVNFSLVVVPDPATCALLAPAMLLALRRRRRP